MKFIATDVSDTKRKMVDMATTQQGKPGFAIDPYFYRSHVTYQAELENIIFKRKLKEVINIENKFYSSTSTDDDFFETVLTFLQARIDKS